jgi:hypothetical protein
VEEGGRGAISRYEVDTGAEAVEAAGTRTSPSSEEAYADEEGDAMTENAG